MRRCGMACATQAGSPSAAWASGTSIVLRCGVWACGGVLSGVLWFVVLACSPP